MRKAEKEALITSVGTFVAARVDKALAPVLERLAVLETQVAAAPQPRDGKDADPQEVAEIVRAGIASELAEIRSAVESIEPAPELPDIPSMVSELVESAVAALPPAEKGEDGAPGRDGVDGKDADSQEIAALLLPEVEKAVAAIPVPKDGTDGRDGKDGEPGKDGVGLAGAFINRAGELTVTLTDGTTRELGCIVGKDGTPGEPGKDGQDGLGFDNLEVLHDGGRGFTLRFARGQHVKEYGFTIPAVLDCGVYADDREYQKGDGVSYGGSFWIAQEDGPKDQPGTGKGWRLAVKRGRDGKDGVVKEPKDPGPVRGFPGDKKDDDKGDK